MKKFITIREIPWARLQDVIITALEGGSNYWYWLNREATATISKYKGDYDEQIHGPYRDRFYGTLTEAVLVAVKHRKLIPIHDIEEKSQPIGHLSLQSIQRGINKMAHDRRRELDMLICEDVDFDADDADVIFQYITMGELVYG